MNLTSALAAWLDLRPGEGRKLTLSFLGAFLVLGFLTVARSLRDALYLAEFNITTLPYITAAVALARQADSTLQPRLLTARP